MLRIFKSIKYWYQMMKIGTSGQWMKIYKEYQELLVANDVAVWFSEQFDIANKEREELKKRVLELETKLQEYESR